MDGSDVPLEARQARRFLSCFKRDAWSTQYNPCGSQRWQLSVAERRCSEVRAGTYFEGITDGLS